jgi:hypothetical protein
MPTILRLQTTNIFLKTEYSRTWVVANAHRSKFNDWLGLFDSNVFINFIVLISCFQICSYQNPDLCRFRITNFHSASELGELYTTLPWHCQGYKIGEFLRSKMCANSLYNSNSSGLHFPFLNYLVLT